MKIADIRVNDLTAVNQIRSIFDSQPRTILLEQLEPLKAKSLPALFINAVLQSKTLSENDLGTLQKLFGMGISKLKTAITPGTSKDLDMLLAFMAPRGGGVRRIEELIDAARQMPIQDNDDWWDVFYQAFNLDDDLVKQDIRDRVSEEFITQQKPAVPGGHEVGGKRLHNFLDVLRNSQANRRSQLDKVHSRLDKLRKSANVNNRYTEDRLIWVASMLCEDQRIKHSFNRIANLLHHQLNLFCEEKLPYFNNKALYRMLSEGPLDQFRTFLGNPNYAKSEFGKQKQTANTKLDRSKQLMDSERAAKLAVNIAKNYLRQKFNADLEDAGLLPAEIAKVYATWQKLAQIRHKNQEQLASYRVLGHKLEQAMKLFQPALKDIPQAHAFNPGEPSPGPGPGPGDPEVVDAEYVGPGAQPNPQEEAAKRAVRSIAKKMIKLALTAKQNGQDADYAVRSYMIKVARHSPNLAKYLLDAWANATQGNEGSITPS